MYSLKWPIKLTKLARTEKEKKMRKDTNFRIIRNGTGKKKYETGAIHTDPADIKRVGREYYK